MELNLFDFTFFFFDNYLQTIVFIELPHSLQNVELAIVKAHFGVAENSAL